MQTLIAHPSAGPAGDFKTLRADRLRGVDLVITTYGSLLRAAWIAEVPWHLVVLDEAQAIKNPDAKQTRAVKNLKPEARMALTGTPVENRLGDLWSLFDFINPGLLGSAKEFTKFTKRLAEGPHASYGRLRELVKPYILRRLKTDRTVIPDLPDKTEIKAFCPLTRPQAAMYERSRRSREPPALLPDGRHFVYTRFAPGSDAGGIYEASLNSSSRLQSFRYAARRGVLRTASAVKKSGRKKAA